MDLGIKRLRVLVTAGGGGIGLRVAEALLREGASVYTCDIDRSALDALNKAHPEIGSCVCDVADRSAVAKLFDEAIKALGGLDCLATMPVSPGRRVRYTKSIRANGTAAWKSV